MQTRFKLALTISLLCGFSSLFAQPQIVDDGSPDKYSMPQTFVIDTVQLICIYEENIVRPPNEYDERLSDAHRMMLQIGHIHSKYYDEKRYINDSLAVDFAKRGVREIEGINILLKLGQTSNYMVFKNYPKGFITDYAYMLGGWYYTEEPTPSINWTIHQETKQLLGYSCIKATCSLFGREYTAWFTPEIPISEGPWKLAGLPGLILDTVDATGDVSFSCVEISRPKRVVSMIKHIIRDEFSVTKEVLRKLQIDYFNNPFGTIQASGLVQDASGTPIKKRYKTYIELDF